MSEKNAVEKIITDVSEDITDFDAVVQFLDVENMLEYMLAEKLFKIYMEKGLPVLRDTIENNFGVVYSDEELEEKDEETERGFC